MKKLYDVLGVEEDASNYDIKKAFRKKAAEFHPDKNKSSHAPERMVELNTAYDILSDEDKRRSYDKKGDADCVDDIDSLANNVIFEMYFKLLENFNFIPTDYISEIKLRLENTKAVSEEVEKKLKNHIDCFEYLIGHTTVCDKFNELQIEKLVELKTKLDFSSHTIRVLNRALDLLSSFNYYGTTTIKSKQNDIVSTNKEPYIA